MSNPSQQQRRKDLPPSRPPPHTDITKKVSPPLSNTRLSSLIYTLVLLTALLTGWYAWSFAKGTTNSVLYGSPDPSNGAKGGYAGTSGKGGKAGRGRAGKGEVEHHLTALASALGIPPPDLARALAGAVRAHIPPASLRSFRERETGGVVEVLFQEVDEGVSSSSASAGESASTPGIVGTVIDTVDKVVGLDEP